MSTGAKRLERSFLWTQRKFISMLLMKFDRTRIWTGTPEMKATSLRDFDARTPMCQSSLQPGAFKALWVFLVKKTMRYKFSAHTS